MREPALRRSPVIAMASSSAALAVVVLGQGLLAAPVYAQESGSSSAVTISGKGQFADLKVTVGQTRELTNQVVKVTWTGGTPTPSDGYSKNYLQIFQCWGEDPEGPDRTQCQFGGFTGDVRGGADSFTASRQVSYGGPLRDDPAEPLKYGGGFYQASVPFRSATGKTIPGIGDESREFFNQYTTNEIPYARTNPDGTGEQYFEIQTALDAPGLGCGKPVTVAATTTGRGCWLVVVPRGDSDVNEVAVTGSASLYSSPLVTSTWKHRLVIPLAFQPIASSCRIGASEVETVGHESIEEAIGSWQPKLCALTGSIYGYSQVPDSKARTKLATKPSMEFLSSPVDPQRLDEGNPAVYAPVAANAVVIAFNVYSNSGGRAPPPEVTKDDGRRLLSMKLNARLVAKLLTQTYRLSLANAFAPQTINNPEDLVNDEEFRSLNPNFTGRGRRLPPLARALVTVSNADSINTLWRWIASDRDAAAFMQGKPDQWGTRINPNYKGMDLGIDRFPRSDLYCAEISPVQPKLCEFDAHPYAADNHDAARSASRGDTLGRLYDPSANPPSFKKVPPQPVGQQGILAITDAATAVRYGLPTAQLKNAAGRFVAADPAAMRAAVGQMKPATGSTVLRPNPSGTSATAYPLTTVSYAATVPTKITKAEAAAYKKFIEYAVGAGQTLGTQEGDLPPGYAPLPAGLRSEALSVAADIVKRQATGPVVEPALITESAPSNSQVLSGAAVSVPIAPVQIGAVSPTAGGLPQGTPIGAVISAAQALLASVGTSRFGPAGALALGLAALISGPVLLRIGAGHA